MSSSFQSLLIQVQWPWNHSQGQRRQDPLILRPCLSLSFCTTTPLPSATPTAEHSRERCLSPCTPHCIPFKTVPHDVADPLGASERPPLQYQLQPGYSQCSQEEHRTEKWELRISPLPSRGNWTGKGEWGRMKKEKCKMCLGKTINGPQATASTSSASFKKACLASVRYCKGPAPRSEGTNCKSENTAGLLEMSIWAKILRLLTRCLRDSLSLAFTC